MEKKIKTIYYCDHCKKQYFSMSACQKHEDNCAKKPENQNPCLSGCKHLVTAKSPVCYDSCSGGYYQEVEFEANCFQCLVTDELMFPHSAEKLNQKYDLESQGQSPMPKVFCPHYELELFDLNVDLFKD